MKRLEQITFYSSAVTMTESTVDVGHEIVGLHPRATWYPKTTRDNVFKRYNFAQFNEDNCQLPSTWVSSTARSWGWEIKLSWTFCNFVTRNSWLGSMVESEIYEKITMKNVEIVERKFSLPDLIPPHRHFLRSLAAAGVHFRNWNFT